VRRGHNCEREATGQQRQFEPHDQEPGHGNFPKTWQAGAVFQVASLRVDFHHRRMSEIIYPRSPRELMDGWPHLPRYIDKIRLYLAGQLHADYQPNFGKGFDGGWLKAAGVTHEQMVGVVEHSVTDGEVCDWVRQNVKKTAAEKAAFLQTMLNYPKADDAEGQARLKMRKEQAGVPQRDDIKCFVDFIDVDEKRL
jgi:hypothetical protein